MSEFTAADHLHLAQALRLAEQGAWTTRPNPMAGCVIVRDGEVVGLDGSARRHVVSKQPSNANSRFRVSLPSGSVIVGPPSLPPSTVAA